MHEHAIIAHLKEIIELLQRAEQRDLKMIEEMEARRARVERFRTPGWKIDPDNTVPPATWYTLGPK